MTDNQKKFWDELKQKHPDALLLFRCGDFYEAYCEDAKVCAKILGIALTWRTPTMRHKPGDYSDAMAGFPHHALDSYLPKLVRAGKRVAICDWPTEPAKKKRGITETINENKNQNSETMTQNLKAADLIGKVIIVGDNVAKYVVKGVASDGEILHTEFTAGENKPFSMDLPMGKLKGWLDAGTCHIDGVSTTTTSDEVEEVSDVNPKTEEVSIKGKAKPKSDKPKGFREPDPEAVGEIVDDTRGKLSYETYTNKKGKTCARIVGFAEDAAAYQRETAEKLHASASYEKDKKGNRLNYLCFGPRYAAAAKQICDALNKGKTIAECQAIIDATTEERAQQREEWKQKHNGPTYTAQEVAAIIENFAAGKELPDDIRKHLKKAA